MDKIAVELVKKQTLLGFFNRLFLVPKPNNRWRPTLDLSKLNQFLKLEKFKIETPETIRTSLQQGEWVTSTVQEYFCPGPVIQVQSSAIWAVHSTLGIYSDCQRGQTDSLTQGYKDPPVPR